MTDTALDLAAAPYAGGDPYADYRAAGAHEFTGLTDLADRRLGGAVVAAGDEFFADRENLLLPGRPEFRPHTFGNKGQLMDGWETRRRRGGADGGLRPTGEEYDWALIRLGVPGVVHGVLVDTAHFRGNHPPAVSVEAVELPGTPGPAELAAADWRPLVPRSAVRGHAANLFAVQGGSRVTHLRLRQYPDGGIARLRVYGEARPDPRWLAALGTFDLAALEYGGVVEDASDRFYSEPTNVLLPDRSRVMGDGWETKRRRDEGHDWLRLRLAGRGTVRAVEIDTANYLGNAAGWVTLSGRDGEQGDWFELLPRLALQPDTCHRLPLPVHRPATHVRLDVFPDGGIARLRLHGSLSE
ncbi:allantoicase [Kitasatospora sp. MMS16-BH015]|uniref:allantoicase n=1 Tax=Kitasatospora sp. MMS16-BH015 TaxID=2018025 RepID=UPI000CF20700|nr:allantoicase [Kitasatospora sp. MMS16-BH015]